MHIITLILLSVFLNSSAQISMKKGMMIVGEITGGVQGFVAVLPSMITNIYLWISALSVSYTQMKLPTICSV